MALNYLLSPTFQAVSTAGKPLTGGYIETYLAGTRTKYFCASDFSGTLHPFKIPLDALGSNIVLADDGQSYDVYIYNRYGSLSMSRYNVNPSEGGGVSTTNITSTDGSIIVTNTADGVDLSVANQGVSLFKGTGQSRTIDGNFGLVMQNLEGNKIIFQQNSITLSEGWYHYDLGFRIDCEASPVNQTVSVVCSSSNSNTQVEFDLSYPHSEDLELSGTFHATSNGTPFIAGVSGLQPGLVATLTHIDVYSLVDVAGAGGGSSLDAGNGIVISDDVISIDTEVVATKEDLSGKQDVLTAGTNVQINNNVISATDTTYSAGTGLSLFGTEFSVDTSVIATQSDLSGKQDTLTAGSNITIQNNVISASAAPQVNSDWNATSGVAEILNKPTIPVVPEMKELVAGSNVTITENSNSVTISAAGSAQVNADWNATSGVAEILNKPTIPVVPAMKDLVAGSGVTITEGTTTVTISAAGTSYTAGSGIDITGSVISADTTVLALKSELHTIGTVTL